MSDFVHMDGRIINMARVRKLLSVVQNKHIMEKTSISYRRLNTVLKKHGDPKFGEALQLHRVCKDICESFMGQKIPEIWIGAEHQNLPEEKA